MREDTPLLLGSLGWGEGQPIQLEFLYKKTERQTVSFEVAFTALVATTVLAAPSTNSLIDPVAAGTAILLIGITVSRRMAIDCTSVDQGAFMEKTTRYILLLTFTGLIFIGLSIGNELSRILPLNAYYLAGAALFSISVATVVGYELIYRDLAISIAVLFYNRQLEQPNTSKFYNGFLVIARELVDSFGTTQVKEHPEFQRIYTRDLGETRESSRIVTYVMFLITILVLLSLVVIMALPLAFVLESGIFAAIFIGTSSFVAMVPVLALIQFVFARYGNTSWDQVITELDIVTGIIVTYLMLILHAGIPAL